MRQDRTGASATIAAVVDSPVGSMRNKGTAGGWFTATSDNGRPVLKQDGSKYYLSSDGTDDFLRPNVSVLLTDVWWHVGGWLAQADSDYLFGLTNNIAKSAPLITGTPPTTIRWRNAADTGFTTLVTGTINSPLVLAIERNTEISGRINGVGGASFAPFAETPTGLTLFVASTLSGGGVLLGRFYGGAWGSDVLQTPYRSLLEKFFTGVTLS
jgi:hypothetical protein